MIIFYGITHIFISLALYLITGHDFNLYHLALVSIGSLLPDADYTYSKLGKYNPFAPLMKHRGMFHTILGCLLFKYVALGFGIDTWYPLVFGYISHLLADTLTATGIMWAFPFNKKYYSFKLCKTGDVTELFIFFICVSYLFTEYQIPM